MVDGKITQADVDKAREAWALDKKFREQK